VTAAGPNSPEDGSAQRRTDVSLGELVDQLDSGLRQLTRRVDDHEDQILDTLESFAAELDTLRDELDGQPTTRAAVTRKRPHEDAPVGIPDTGDSADEPPKPRRWAARATPADWDALVDWVDELRSTYSLPSGYVVPPCWPAHPGVVEELAGLHRAWVNAVVTEEQAGIEGSSAMAAWHDRWLWPTLRRFKAASYRISNCQQSHVAEREVTEMTKRDLQPLVNPDEGFTPHGGSSPYA
jgi:hypothetical protein